MFCFLVKKSLLPDTAGAQPTDAAQVTGQNDASWNSAYVGEMFCVSIFSLRAFEAVAQWNATYGGLSPLPMFE